jgi:hypothetical protein
MQRNIESFVKYFKRGKYLQNLFFYRAKKFAGLTERKTTGTSANEEGMNIHNKMTEKASNK